VSPSPENTHGDPQPSREYGGNAPAEREGLPRGYRMRADIHYVDQLEARSAAQPVRHVSVQEITWNETVRPADLGPLLGSIRSHGVIHPLHVRRIGQRYAIVAGRKRLAVARVLRLPTVPCLVHDLDDAAAAALAIADNVTATAVASPSKISPLAVAVGRLVANHLATVQTCVDLVAGAAPSMTRSVLDLVRTHAWRAGRLLDALALIENNAIVSERERALASVIDEVIDGFSAEGGLNAFTLRPQLAGAAAAVRVNAGELSAGLAGAVLATIPLLDPARPSEICLAAAQVGHESVVLDVLPSSGLVSAAFTQRFFDEDSSDRPGGWSSVAGALAARALATRHGGHATFEVPSNGRARLRISLASLR
jgi:hypothetical protein